MVILTHEDLGCRHEFPADWVFGGADELDPRADRRYVPCTYMYIDTSYREVFMTQMFWCDDVAYDYFTTVQNYGKAIKLWKRDAGSEKWHELPVLYRPEDDTVYDVI